MNLSKFKPFK